MEFPDWLQVKVVRNLKMAGGRPLQAHIFKSS